MTAFRIPFGGRAHEYTKEEIATVVSVMKSRASLTQGQFRDRFEDKVRQYACVDHAFAVNTATSALDLAATLCQFNPQEEAEIIVPGHTFTSSVYPFAKRGAKIVWADIDLSTHVVSASHLEARLSGSTRAVIVPHLYGYACDMLEISQFAAENRLILIEDAAQAFGVECDGRKVGTFGDFGVFSFHSHKNISTLGEGGMLLVRDEAHATLVPMLRHNGHCSFPQPRDDYWVPAMGDCCGHRIFALEKWNAPWAKNSSTGQTR
jgi:dTDP-4-amino-4,6-dideoxygalactose transaminase